MQNQQIEAWAKTFSQIIGNIKDPNPLKYSLNGEHLTINSEIVLADKSLLAYKRLSKDMWNKLKCDRNFTQKEFNGILNNLIARYIEDELETRMDQYMEKFAHDIENYQTEQIIYLPLENVEMTDMDELKRASFSIVKMTDNKIEELSQRVKHNFEQNRVYNPEEKSLRIKDWLENYIVPLQGKICFELRYIGGAEKAREKAHEEALRLIDLLRYSIPSIFPDFYPTCFLTNEARKREKQKRQEQKEEYKGRARRGPVLQGELPLGLNRTYIFASDDAEMSFKGSFIGMRPFTINLHNIAIMDQLGIFQVADLLKHSEQKLTPFQNVFLRSLHWFANAQVQLEMEDELLDLVTSLETLLTEKSSHLVDATGYGIAFILGKTVEERTLLMERYEEIYDARSKRTHQGLQEADEIDLIEIRYMAQGVLNFAFKNFYEWKEPNQLRKWVKARMLQ